MRVEEEKDEYFLKRNDPSKYNLKSHDAHNSLVHNKGQVCKLPSEMHQAADGDAADAEPESKGKVAK